MTLPFLRRALRASLLAAGCALLAGLAHAQGGAYPNRVVRVIVPFAASTSPDVVMRIVTPKVAELWGQQIIVENRTGAGGNIGAAAVANAAPDGYTLLYTINSTICANPHLYPSLPYDPFKSFAPVSLIANLGYVLIAKPGLPVRTLPELIAFAKANPGKLNYGSGGNGVGNHIVMELLAGMAGITMQHVPMRTNTVTAVMTGEIDLVMSPYTTGVPAAKGGKVQPLGVSLAKRTEQLPDLPAIGETLPGYVGDAWHGLFAPAGTPPAIVDKIQADFARVLAMPDARKRLLDIGLEPIGSTPADFAVVMKHDYDKWGKVIRDANIKLD
jgi:tripartite-type tricarboxylate transporter receptor subunit TctC